MRTVCFCNSNIPWGGGENWHLNAALSLASRGWRVLLLCHPEGELHRRAQAHKELTPVAAPIGRLSFINPLARERLRKFFVNERVHGLIMNLPADLKAAGPAARAAGVRHIIYRRGSALPVRNTLLNRYLFGRVITRLIVNSLATREQVLANNPFLVPEDRITLLPNGINARVFDEQLAAAASVPRLAPFCGRAFVLGNAGRLTRQKGQHMLLHLAKRLADAGLDVGVLIAGQGEREQELKTLALRLGVADRVVFTGFMETMAPFWRQIDVFILTSLWEGFGSVIIEAMLAQKPVFAFSVSNIPELVREGPEGNGRLFPLPEEEISRSPGTRGPETRGRHPLDMMAGAVLELAADPAEARRMGRAGREFALRFSQDALMGELEDLLA